MLAGGRQRDVEDEAVQDLLSQEIDGIWGAGEACIDGGIWEEAHRRQDLGWRHGASATGSGEAARRASAAGSGEARVIVSCRACRRAGGGEDVAYRWRDLGSGRAACLRERDRGRQRTQERGNEGGCGGVWCGVVGVWGL